MSASAPASLNTGTPGQLFDPVVNRAALIDVLRKARAEEPVFFSPKFNAWIVTRYKDVKFVFNHPREFSSVGTLDAGAKLCPEAEAVLREGAIQYPAPAVLANSDAPEHPRVRAAATRELSPRRFAEMETLLHDLVNRSIDRWIGLRRTDFVASFAYNYPLTVIMGVLGLPLNDLERVKAWGNAWIQLLFNTEASASEQVGWAKSVVEYQRYIRAFIEELRHHPRGDFMSGLVASVYEGGRLTLGELVYLIGLNIIPGAHESTATFLTNCLYNLLKERRNWEELCSNPALIPNAIEEALRFDGPGVGLYRRSTVETIVGGQKIPAGSRVFYCHYSANWDEAIFDKPELFDIHRANANAHIEFGQGNHFCLGAPLARRESRVALEILTRRMPSLRLVPDQALEYVPSLIVRGLSRLEIEWDEG
jgi:cytochrome P450